MASYLFFVSSLTHSKKSVIPPGHCIATLRVQQKLQGSPSPPGIVNTQQRPNFIVLVDRESKSIIIIELTIPFERNIRNAHDHEVNKYSGLILDLQEQNYDAKLFCIEVGSRGLISDDNKCNIQKIFKLISSGNKPNKNQVQTISKKSEQACNLGLLHYFLLKI